MSVSFLETVADSCGYYMSDRETEVMVQLVNLVMYSARSNKTSVRHTMHNISLEYAECRKVETVLRLAYDWTITITPVWQNPGTVASISWTNAVPPTRPVKVSEDVVKLVEFHRLIENATPSAMRAMHDILLTKIRKVPKCVSTLLSLVCI